jgi:hypothetical protein
MQLRPRLKYSGTCWHSVKTRQAESKKKKTYFGVGLRIETPHAAQHGGEVMSGTLVELERVMLPQTW